MTAFVDRARHKLGAGKLAEATRLVEQGLELYPGSHSLLDLRLSLRRARAHKAMRRLESRIEETSDPVAYEELIKLYQDLELPDESQRKAELYCEAHPGRDTPHLVLGEMHLETFIEELSARHGHAARDHLLQAANLNAMALQPRLLLAELYFCVGADRSLAALLDGLRQMAPETQAMEAAFEAMARVVNRHAEEHLDGLFERIEVDGSLVRDPQDWPLSKRKASRTYVDEERAGPAMEALISEGSMAEVVILRRDGTVITHTQNAVVFEGEGALLDTPTSPEAFIEVVRTVSRKVFPHAAEFDMGKFKRCTIRGAFGSAVVGRTGNVIVGARGSRTTEPLRMWERLSLELENVSRGVA